MKWIGVKDKKPKTGEEVLVAMNYPGGHFVVMATWFNGDEPEDTGPVGGKAGFYEADDVYDWVQVEARMSTPTHWMRIPPMPTKQTQLAATR